MKMFHKIMAEALQNSWILGLNKDIFDFQLFEVNE
jgi:hypothetical protein